MYRKPVLSGLLAAGLFLAAAGDLFAGRTALVRNPGVNTPGVRGDITVPFLTTGNQAFFTTSVAPLILTGPRINDRAFPPAAAPIYNMPYYGAVQGFGNQFNGATSRLGSDAPQTWTPTKVRIKLVLPTIY
jgi:hypothetical protein